MLLSEHIPPLLQSGNLEFIARTIAEGFLSGQHTSVQKGVGTDFNQYKVYQQGDDPGKIDWKLFARSDRYFVRESERESECPIHFVMDCSASMDYRADGDKRLSKLAYASYLAGALAYLAQRQGDPASLTCIGAQQPLPIAAGTGLKHWYRMMSQMQNLRAGGQFALDFRASHLSRWIQSACMVVVISDGYQQNTELTDFFGQLKHSKNDVLFLHLHSEQEANFDYRGFVEFVDLETGQRKRVKANQAQAIWLAQQQDWLAQLKRSCDAQSMSYAKFSSDRDFATALHHYLRRRTRIAR